MAEGQLGIGFVGAGWIMRKAHVHCIRADRNAHVAGIMNPTVSKAEALAEENRRRGGDDPACYGDVRELVRDPDVDALWVASPNFARLETIEAIVEELRQGDAIIEGIATEKPLARTVAEGARILDLVESVGVSHAYLEDWAYAPEVTQMRCDIWTHGAPATGRPYLARSEAEHGGPYSAWFWDVERAGGGALLDMLCHSQFVNQLLLSDPDVVDDLEPLAVTGEICNLKWARESYADQLSEEFDVDYAGSPGEDYARASVYYETANGTLAVSEAAGSWSFTGPDSASRIDLIGPEYSGRVRPGGEEAYTYIARDGDDPARHDVDASLDTQTNPGDDVHLVKKGYVDMNAAVVDAFRAGKNARFDLEDGLEVLRICMAAYKSAEEGTQIDLRTTSLEDYVPEPARREFEAGADGIHSHPGR